MLQSLLDTVAKEMDVLSPSTSTAPAPALAATETEVTPAAMLPVAATPEPLSAKKMSSNNKSSSSNNPTAHHVDVRPTSHTSGSRKEAAAAVNSDGTRQPSHRAEDAAAATTAVLLENGTRKRQRVFMNFPANAQQQQGDGCATEDTAGVDERGAQKNNELGTSSTTSRSDKTSQHSVVEERSTAPSDEANTVPERTNGMEESWVVSSCQYERCTKPAIGGRRFCRRHGEGRRCKTPGCNKVDVGGGRCRKHGGGRRCGAAGCLKTDVGGGLCVSHGGGKRCQASGCQKGAQAGGVFCKSHGGGRRCRIPGCMTSAQSGADVLCIKHGGGKRCMVPGCRKLVRKNNRCTKHAAEASGELSLAPQSRQTRPRLTRPRGPTVPRGEAESAATTVQCAQFPSGESSPLTRRHRYTDRQNSDPLYGATPLPLPPSAELTALEQSATASGHHTLSRELPAVSPTRFDVLHPLTSSPDVQIESGGVRAGSTATASLSPTRRRHSVPSGTLPPPPQPTLPQAGVAPASPESKHFGLSAMRGSLPQQEALVPRGAGSMIADVGTNSGRNAVYRDWRLGLPMPTASSGEAAMGTDGGRTVKWMNASSGGNPPPELLHAMEPGVSNSVDPPRRLSPDRRSTSPLISGVDVSRGPGGDTNGRGEALLSAALRVQQQRQERHRHMALRLEHQHHDRFHEKVEPSTTPPPSRGLSPLQMPLSLDPGGTISAPSTTTTTPEHMDKVVSDSTAWPLPRGAGRGAYADNSGGNCNPCVPSLPVGRMDPTGADMPVGFAQPAWGYPPAAAGTCPPSRNTATYSHLVPSTSDAPEFSSSLGGPIVSETSLMIRKMGRASRGAAGAGGDADGRLDAAAAGCSHSAAGRALEAGDIRQESHRPCCCRCADHQGPPGGRSCISSGGCGTCGCKRRRTPAIDEPVRRGSSTDSDGLVAKRRRSFSPQQLSPTYISLSVEGMMCMQNCGKTVQEALSAVEGVRSVTVHFPTRTANVQVEPDCTVAVEDLTAVLEKVGFKSKCVATSTTEEPMEDPGVTAVWAIASALGLVDRGCAMAWGADCTCGDGCNCVNCPVHMKPVHMRKVSKAVDLVVQAMDLSKADSPPRDPPTRVTPSGSVE